MNYHAIQYPCGCQFQEDVETNKNCIRYCPKHGAAEDMYKALTEIKADSTYPKLRPHTRVFINQALAKADGK